MFCPQEVEFGNVAEVAGAVIALIAAGTVAYLGYQANRTTAAIRDMEAKRDAAEAKSRHDERLIILMSLNHVISMALVHLRSVKQAIESPANAGRLKEENFRLALANMLNPGTFTISDGVRGRLHCVDMTTAAKLIRAEGAIPLFVTGLATLTDAQGKLADGASRTLQDAMAIAENELEVVWRECLLACREAGLDVEVDEETAATPAAPQ
jgi:hypothetical protein